MHIDTKCPGDIYPTQSRIRGKLQEISKLLANCKLHHQSTGGLLLHRTLFPSALRSCDLRYLFSHLGQDLTNRTEGLSPLLLLPPFTINLAIEQCKELLVVIDMIFN